MKNIKMRLLSTAILLITGIVITSFSKKNESKLAVSNIKSDVQIGVITYSFRSMPDQSAEATLKYILESGINSVELMGGPAESFAGKPKNTTDFNLYRSLKRKKQKKNCSADELLKLKKIETQIEDYNKAVVNWRATVSMDKFKALRKMYNDAGVSIYAFKPDALRAHHTDEEIGWAMRAAKALGATHVTVELPNNPKQTKRLGALGKKHKMHIGYHGHTQQTPTFWDNALEQSKYNGINLDLGHYIAAGHTDAIAFIKKNHKRILSMHLKDRKNLKNGQKNMIWGQGDTPIAEVLHLIKDNNYKFPVTVEMEYEVREGLNAVDEVKTCADYCDKILK